LNLSPSLQPHPPRTIYEILPDHAPKLPVPASCSQLIRTLISTQCPVININGPQPAHISQALPFTSITPGTT
jgi:hypothetical protein